MRDPDQLPSVLHSLLAHPNVQKLINSPTTLVNYLRHQGWPELPEELDPLWGMSIHPDSQEANEEAQILPQVEEQLAALNLNPQQQEWLLKALTAICPECRETAQTLLRSSPALT